MDQPMFPDPELENSDDALRAVALVVVAFIVGIVAFAIGFVVGASP